MMLLVRPTAYVRDEIARARAHHDALTISLNSAKDPRGISGYQTAFYQVLPKYQKQARSFRFTVTQWARFLATLLLCKVLRVKPTVLG